MSQAPASSRPPQAEPARRTHAPGAARPETIAPRPQRLEFPDSLPVSARKDEIMAALTKHQVIIVCGETGSGKTTQLPKIALALGRGCV